MRRGLAALNVGLSLQRLVGCCVLASVAVAALASVTQQPYSVPAPKRVLLQHLFVQGPDGAVKEAKIVVSGSDVGPLEHAVRLPGYESRNSSYRDWQVRAPPRTVASSC